VRRFLEEALEDYWGRWRTEMGKEEVERLRRDITNTVGIALALLDELEWGG
jgi:hypothetical protein